MAGVTGTSQINDAVEKFVAESRYTLQERSGVGRSAMRIETFPSNEGPSVNIPKYGQVTTYALTEGVDMAQAQQITDTGMTITPTEYGAQVFLTDLNMMEAKDSFMEVARRILRDSFDRQQDQVLMDDYSSFSVDNGAAAAVLNVGEVMAGHASIKYNAPADGTAGRGGEPAPDPSFGVFTPAQIHALNKSLIGGTGASVVHASGGTASVHNTPETERAKMIGGAFTIDGIPGLTIMSDINLNKDTNDDVVGTIKSKEAAILVELGSVGIAPERDESLRGTEVNIVGRWARGEYDDDWGRAMTFDSALPTG